VRFIFQKLPSLTYYQHSPFPCSSLESIAGAIPEQHPD
jgi:hypothetical protein